MYSEYSVTLKLQEEVTTKHDQGAEASKESQVTPWCMITSQVPGIYSLVHSISVDEENKRRLESEIAECRTAQTVVEEEIKKLEGEMRQVEDRWNNLQKQREDIEARKKAVNEANKQMEGLKLRLGEVPSNDYIKYTLLTV